MMVGDLQRLGFDVLTDMAIAQEVPNEVNAACEVLVDAGYTSRLIQL